MEEIKHLEDTITKREIIEMMDTYGIYVADQFKKGSGCKILLQKIGERSASQSASILNKSNYINNLSKQVAESKEERYQLLLTENTLLKSKLRKLSNVHKLEEDYKQRIDKLQKMYRKEITNLLNERQNYISEMYMYKNEYQRLIKAQ